ncbi:hypothetical protein F5I97DRAFT_2002082 [Phlebopus sp. FC_14]|nr:hypothetical protein F5I97DRAFT_2002082 [Phlebopus sp. FC_14]
MTPPNGSQPRPRPLFLYGTLRALSLLAWAITGDSRQISVIEPLVEPARVQGYARFSLHGKDYPAAVKHAETSVVDGLLFRPQNRLQRKKLGGFEGEAYQTTPTPTTMTTTTTVGVEEQKAELNGDSEDLSDEEWVLDVFERERLRDWLDLFGGMELVGEEEDDDEE